MYSDFPSLKISHNCTCSPPFPIPNRIISVPELSLKCLYWNPLHLKLHLTPAAHTYTIQQWLNFCFIWKLSWVVQTSTFKWNINFGAIVLTASIWRFNGRKMLKKFCNDTLVTLLKINVHIRRDTWIRDSPPPHNFHVTLSAFPGNPLRGVVFPLTHPTGSVYKRHNATLISPILIFLINPRPLIVWSFFADETKFVFDELLWWWKCGENSWGNADSGILPKEIRAKGTGKIYRGIFNNQAHYYFSRAQDFELTVIERATNIRSHLKSRGRVMGAIHVYYANVSILNVALINQVFLINHHVITHA